MYESYWQLSAKPFGGGCDTGFYYPGESHQAALLKLRYAVESHGGAALLVGRAGLGKSLVARVLAERLPDGFSPPTYLTFPQMPPANLLAYLAHELQPSGVSPPRESSIDDCVRTIGRCLIERAQSGKHATIVIDEAHLLEGTRTFEALRLLLNFEHQGRPTTTLVLVGQPALLPLLERMPQLEQRIAIKCLLRPCTLDETHAYVAHRLHAAGGTRTIFEPKAVEALHAVAQGAPRDINRLADLALLLAFADGAATIGPDVIESVADELVNLSAS